MVIVRIYLAFVSSGTLLSLMIKFAHIVSTNNFTTFIQKLKNAVKSQDKIFCNLEKKALMDVKEMTC